ncbi:phage tail tape measure protein [Desulfoluna sp.]|uniref:phage tail tape measure protein n=1 Tax=Desulfoluna sp. TaxID=2045199 RepID=UPI00262E8EA8|nr:phage tail tape measure protein [Desulfoluna sp.]
MADQLQKLMFSIDLMDKVTGPAGKIQNSIQGVTDTFSKVAGGAAGVAAAGYAVSALTAPANEFNMAIGEVRSLDVAQDSLDQLADEAIAFSVKYGESAKDFVSSSYDIQSAIAGLSGQELASFTNASNVLAKGTKSDAATITDYMGTMYGIFQDSATSMGKAEWVEQLTGQTATAVQMFKTTGAEMAGAFTALGANATSAGRSQAEQMAVLGKLQATMSGSEAGTKYKAFLSGIGGAQDKLGLSFTDSSGRMLGVMDILGKIQGKFGDTLDVAESDALKKAFGSDEAVSMIKLLSADVDGLGDSINQLGDVTGMDKAMTMADAMVDPFQRWSQGAKALRIGLGQALLPVLIPVVEGMAEGAGAMYKWTQENPTLTRYLGYTVIGVAGLTAGVAAFAVVGGVASMTMTGFGAAMTLVSGVMTAWSTVAGAGATVMTWLNAVMMANPALLIAGSIAVLVGGIAAAIYYWDDLKAAFLDSTWGKNIMGWIDTILGGFSKLSGAWDWVKNKLSWVPGMGGESEAAVSPTMTALGADPMVGVPKTSPSLEVPRRTSMPAGGVSQSIATAITNTSASSSQTIHIGQITTSRPINAQEVTSQLVMAS